MSADADRPGTPDWLGRAGDRLAEAIAHDAALLAGPARVDARPCAILIVFSAEPGVGQVPRHPADARVLLTERAHTLRSHAAQVAFPGGAIDAEDGGPTAAALREAHEETGLDPDTVSVVTTLPELPVPRSNNVVTPVLAWSAKPSAIGVMDPTEVASVHWISLGHLLDPAHRLQVRHPVGLLSPAFLVPASSGVPDPSPPHGAADLIVWGFTGGLLERIFALTGWERPWDRERTRELPGHLVDRPQAEDRPREDGRWPDDSRGVVA